MDFQTVTLEVLNKDEATHRAKKIEDDMHSRHYDPFYYNLTLQRMGDTPEKLFRDLEEQPVELESHATLEGTSRTDKKEYSEEAERYFEKALEEWRSGDLETTPSI